jgi:hypothetical protein
MEGSCRGQEGVCLEALRKSTENRNQDSQYPSPDLNPGPLGCEGILTTRPLCSVLCVPRRKKVQIWFVAPN